MCGILGVASVYRSPREYVDQLFTLNMERGNRGFGFVAVGQESLVEGPMFYSVHRRTGPYIADHILHYPFSAPLFLGHLRAPTGPDASIVGTHPFQMGRFLLAHNGILLNHKQLIAEFGWELPGVDVDSATILAGIHHLVLRNGMQLSDAIAEVVSRCRGQQACWLLDTQTNDVYLWRVMSPIHVRQNASTVAFSSKRFDHNIHIPSIDRDTMLDEGKVYRLSYEAVALSVVNEFPFESIYEIRR